ncbi:metal ABC transporter ATP-binding protein [Orientia tsutsugamushi]|uniref:Zinc ABC transporter ATP-binding protein n=1 Tax=Orientia tsutsugamushi (strain Boryong) TaxID=357244 RepID=A5CF89_ORITB|nr:metal ABC transporter ATP-binding protein [Orientia tsutsugamushi]CAM81005.1 Zinc ABC transporter ATP-binding protein [Orientia tsutsugamushi str. Boryong]
MTIAEFKKVSKSYSHNYQAIKDINFKIKANEITTLVGPNGAGKTTVAKLLLGLEQPTSGDIVKQDWISLSYVPQKIHLNYNLPINVSEFLSYVASNHQNTVTQVMDFINFEFIKNKQLTDLSGGQMQRVAIAASLLKESDLIVLDEPTQGLDVIAQQQLYDLLKKCKQIRKTAIFIISHDLHTVMLNTDQVLCINQHICCSSYLFKYSKENRACVANLMELDSQIGIYTHNHDHTHN